MFRTVVMLTLIPSALMPNQFVLEHADYTVLTRDAALAFGAFCVFACGTGMHNLYSLPAKYEQEIARKRAEEERKRIDEGDEEAKIFRRQEYERNASFVHRLQELRNVDLYARLGVDANATDDQIKAAHRRLNIQHHPDRAERNLRHDLNNGKINEEQFNSQMAQAQQAASNRFEAHDILTNPVQRRMYDAARGGRLAGIGNT